MITFLNYNAFDQHGFKEIDGYVSHFVRTLMNYCLYLEFLFSKFGAILNIFHLIILCQKSMRTSSTNIIMIGIAICDFICMLIIIKHDVVLLETTMPCSPPRSLTQMRLDWLVTSVHNALRRCSAWLAMSMTIVRYRVITDITVKNSKFSTPKFGLKTTLRAFFISFLFSILFYFHVDIVEIGTWHPDESCGLSDDILPVYTEQYSDFFESNNGLIARGRLLLEGIFAKLIPCFTVPVLTGLLIYEIRKSRISSTVEISVANKKSRKSRQDRTTILIIIVAGSFLISEFPLGIVDMYKAMWIGDMNYETLAQNVVYLCDAIFTINASIHCLFFFAMSIQYRKTVWHLVGRLNCYKRKKQSQVAIVMSSY